MTETTEVAVVTPKVAAVEQKKAIELAGGSVQLKTLDDQFRWAQYVIDSGLAPKAYNKPSMVMIACQLGVELGFGGPMTALKAIHVIDGTPSLSGQAALALCWSKGVFVKVLPLVVEGEGDERTATFSAWRKGNEEMLPTRFTIADARKADLLGKKNWRTSPDDMLEWRAIGRWMKRYASDVTLGLPLYEEAQDYDFTIEQASAKQIERKEQDSAPLEISDAIIVPDDDEPAQEAAAETVVVEQASTNSEEEKFYPAEAQKLIIAEAKRRVGSDEDAVKDLLKQVTNGGVSKITTRELAAAAQIQMAAHPQFGDD